MIEASGTVVIHRPAAEVFAFVADGENLPRWNPTTTAARTLTEGPVRAGTRVATTNQLLGRSFPSEFKVVEHVPHRRFASRTVSGPMRITAAMLLEPAGTGTRFTQRVEVEPLGFLTLAAPVLAGVVQRQLEAALAGLKDSLEAPAPP